MVYIEWRKFKLLHDNHLQTFSYDLSQIYNLMHLAKVPTTLHQDNSNHGTTAAGLFIPPTVVNTMKTIPQEKTRPNIWHTDPHYVNNHYPGNKGNRYK